MTAGVTHVCSVAGSICFCVWGGTWAGLLPLPTHMQGALQPCAHHTSSRERCRGTSGVALCCGCCSAQLSVSVTRTAVHASLCCLGCFAGDGSWPLPTLLGCGDSSQAECCNVPYAPCFTSTGSLCPRVGPGCICTLAGVGVVFQACIQAAFDLPYVCVRVRQCGLEHPVGVFGAGGRGWPQAEQCVHTHLPGQCPFMLG